MIFINGISVIKTDKNTVVQTYLDPNAKYFNMVDIGDMSKVHADLRTEVIEAKTYVNARGEKIRLGMTKEIQDYLGLPLEVMENQHKEKAELVESLGFYVSLTPWELIKVAWGRWLHG